MKKILWILLLVVTGMNADLITLNDANFKKQIKSHKRVAVLFTAPWCGACKSMKPIYTKFALQNKEKTVITTMDIEKNKKTSSLYNIESIPTLILLENGKETKRTSGGLSLGLIELFINTKTALGKYVKKCNDGDGTTCLRIGELYEEGEILKKNYQKALNFYSLACKFGNDEGCAEVNKLK